MDRPSELDAFDEYDGPRGFARQAFVTGAAVTLPLIVTLAPDAWESVPAYLA